MKSFIALVAGVVIGWFSLSIYYDLQVLNCHDFSTKHSKWVGYIAKDKLGDFRCFWLEQEYPNRVRQGRI